MGRPFPLKESALFPAQKTQRLGLLVALITLAWPAPGSTEEQSDTSVQLELVEALEAVFVDVAARIRPSVVMVEVKGQRGPEQLEALKDLIPDLPPLVDPSAGTGSGFLIDEKGTVFTNNHVVQGASEIDVLLSDGQRYEATLVGADVESDVAVIRILTPPKSLQPAPLGNSDTVQVGQFAIAVGSPMGFQNSFTVGHVSAKGRSNVGLAAPGIAAPGFENLAYQDFLQVDTPINPGNSGGPLIDIHGRVIGINTAIIAGGGGGIGFSIPINMARNIADQLIQEGRVRRGWLGVQPRDFSSKQREAGLTVGAWIEAVLPETPAARAGLQGGDVVLTLNNKDISNTKDLLSVVASSPIGKKLPCRVSRESSSGDRENLMLEVTLDERPTPEDRRAMAPRTRKAEPALGNSFLERELGLTLQVADRGENNRLGRKSKASGVIVTKVAVGSPAEEAGLKIDDVLLEVDRQKVTTPDAVLKAMRTAKRDFIPLAIERKGARRHLSIERP